MNFINKFIFVLCIEIVFFPEKIHDMLESSSEQ